MSLSPLRAACNATLRRWAPDLTGVVANFGAGTDIDREGRHYRDYCTGASHYVRLDLRAGDLRVDLTSMPQVPDDSYDAGLCLWVLEHIHDVTSAVSEMRRVLKPGATLIIGVPLDYPAHGKIDVWRFSVAGLRKLLEDWKIDHIQSLGPRQPIALPDGVRFFGGSTKTGPLGWLVKATCEK